MGAPAARGRLRRLLAPPSTPMHQEREGSPAHRERSGVAHSAKYSNSRVRCDCPAADHAGFDMKRELPPRSPSRGTTSSTSAPIRPRRSTIPIAPKRWPAAVTGRPSRARHHRLRQRRRRLDCRQQVSRHSRRGLPRHLHRPPGSGARRHERAVPRRARHRRRAGRRRSPPRSSAHVFRRGAPQPGVWQRFSRSKRGSRADARARHACERARSC